MQISQHFLGVPILFNSHLLSKLYDISDVKIHKKFDFMVGLKTFS